MVQTLLYNAPFIDRYKERSWHFTFQSIYRKISARKSVQENPKRYLKYSDFLALFNTNIYPGMWFGQSLVYLQGIIKKRMYLQCNM